MWKPVTHVFSVLYCSTLCDVYALYCTLIKRVIVLPNSLIKTEANPKGMNESYADLFLHADHLRGTPTLGVLTFVNAVNHWITTNQFDLNNLLENLVEFEFTRNNAASLLSSPQLFHDVPKPF